MRLSFNDDWLVRPKQNAFLELMGGGGEAEPVTVPHDAMIDGDRDPAASHANAYFAPGVWEYTKTFAVPEDWRNRRVRLQFEGIYRDAMVYVNDDFAGAQPYGYSELIVDLDPYLRPGADNTVGVECRAGDDSRWYSGAGIYRPVHLWVQDLVHIEIDGVAVTTPEVDADLAVVEIATEIRNDTRRTVTVQLTNVVTGPGDSEVTSGSIPVTLRPHTTVVGRQRLAVPDPELWDPEQPSLHTCATAVAVDDATAPDPLELDQAETRFGIRSLRLDTRHGLRVNGRTVKLRGACVHHDNGPIGAATIGRAEERRVELLQAAGFNALRSAHNPMSRAMLDACDRLGVLVMDETFDMWTENKSDHDYALRFSDRWRADVAGMVRKDRNHPSVILYSTGNEIPEVGSGLGAALARDIAEEIRGLDPTRYVTNGIQPVLAIRDMITRIREFAAGEPVESGPAEDDAAQGVNTMMTQWAQLKDRFMESETVADCLEEVSASLDVAGYNYLESRYPIDAHLHPDRVIVGSETYITAIASAWPLIMDLDNVIGDFTWTGWDYLGEVGIGRTTYATDAEPTADGQTEGVAAPFPWIVAHTGDLDITGLRRPRSYFREIVFGLRDDPFIAVQRPRSVGRAVTYAGPWSWTDSLDCWTWTGAEGTSLEIEVYSDADEVELLCNGRSLGRESAGQAHEFRSAFTVPYEPGELVAIAYSGGTETGRTTLRTADEATVALRATADRMTLRADPDDLGFVTVAIADAAGAVHPGLDKLIAARITGPATIAAFANADPMTTERYSSTDCTTHEGRALAVIRPTGSGDVEVEFTAEGFDPITVKFTIA